MKKWLDSQIIEKDLKSKIEWIKLLYHKQKLMVFWYFGLFGASVGAIAIDEFGSFMWNQLLTVWSVTFVRLKKSLESQ